MSSSLGDRGILAARLDVHLGSSVDVLCTHLTPTFSDIPYAGEFDSWEGERDHHLSELTRFASDRDDGGLEALLGDMNCGPETSLAAGAGPEAFAAFGRAGYSSPYAEGESPACTFCQSNPLVGGAPRGSGDVGVILDHVLLSELPAPFDVTARRVLDQGIEIESEGRAIETAHSDHYGVMASLERNP
jgi:endonuclease/exonuclease/phosphatase family metal-dependent hydrolase